MPDVKKIVIFKEKHGDRYFDATDEKELNKVFLLMLRERKAMGYYYEPDPDYPVEWEEAMKVPDDTLNTLPEGIRDQIFRLRKAYKRLERETRIDREWFRLANELLAMPKAEAENHVHTWTVNLSTGPKKKEKLMATFLMDCRKDGEYEGFEIIELETVDGPRG